MFVVTMITYVEGDPLIGANDVEVFAVETNMDPHEAALEIAINIVDDRVEKEQKYDPSCTKEDLCIEIDQRPKENEVWILDGDFPSHVLITKEV